MNIKLSMSNRVFISLTINVKGLSVETYVLRYEANKRRFCRSRSDKHCCKNAIYMFRKKDYSKTFLVKELVH